MGTTYKIKPGDNLSTIASKYGTTVGALQKANGIANPNLIIAGKTLNIPSISVDNSKLEGSVANYGDFAWSDQGKYDQLIKDYEDRGKFSYDFNADALYQQYKDKYIQQGKMAMADTMGQAAAMTGGYGNSYAQTVGQQQYQASLDKLNDVIPELYQLAYEKHNQEGRDMLNMIGYAYNNYRDMITDQQWQKNYELSERELKMAEEAWELEKKAYDDVADGGSDPLDVFRDNKTPKAPDIKPTETKATNSFIANHQTKDEYMRRNKSYKEFLAYIEAEIEKAEGSLSDEELMYLIQYYGLS